MSSITRNVLLAEQITMFNENNLLMLLRGDMLELFLDYPGACAVKAAATTPGSRV
jgi:hypothetical protein